MNIRTPVIVVNFKAYKNSIGKNAVKLAKICEECAKETGAEIVVCVQVADVHAVKSAVRIPVFVEHMDPINFGAHTGQDLPEDLVENGASGVLINHSEDKVTMQTIKEDINRARDVGLKTLVCGVNTHECKYIVDLEPDFVAIEPPELIGGDVSVSTSKPELVSNSADIINESKNKTLLLVGAGVKSSDDVKKSLKLGAKGVLLASGITKAESPKKVLLELCKGL